MTTVTKNTKLPFIQDGLTLYLISIALSIAIVYSGPTPAHPLMSFVSTLLVIMLAAFLVIGNTKAFLEKAQEDNKYRPLPEMVHRFVMVVVIGAIGLVLAIPMMIWPNNLGATITLVLMSIPPGRSLVRKLVRK
jgi:hypothetical protein